MVGRFNIGERSYSFSGEGEYVIFGGGGKYEPAPAPTKEEEAKAAAYAAEARRQSDAASKIVPTKDQLCKNYAQGIVKYDGWLRLRQAPHARRWLEENKAHIISEQRDLGC